MDKTLDDIDSMERRLCHICQHDIPIDDDSPDGLMRHVCVWILLIKAPVYLGTRNDWVCCCMCSTCINIPHGNLADVLIHLTTRWCRDEARHRLGLPKTWHGGWIGWWVFLY